MNYKVKEVAQLVGISVRTLHHYHQIGLLTPSSITSSGYRLYDDGDLERLQQVLFFKELDFNLSEIKEIIDSPNFDRKHALENHRELLYEKMKRLENIIESVNKTIDVMEGKRVMDNKEMFEGFDISEIEKHKEKYAQETRERYGNTDAYAESQRRTSKYSKEDWARIMERQGEIYNKLAALMDKEPSNLEVQKVIEENRQHITDSFYNCTVEIYRGLGQLYVNDQRFTKNIDKFKEGLAKFLSDAIKIYCDNTEKENIK